MAESPCARQAYPFAVVATATGFAASALQFASLATAATRTELDRLMREQSALYLLEHRLNRTSPERPRAEGGVDLSDWVDADPRPTVVYAAPAAVNDVSVAIEVAIRDEGLTYAELARRMALPRSVVTRLTDPFYFGHTTATLRKVAHALGRALHASVAVDRGVRASAASTDRVESRGLASFGPGTSPRGGPHSAPVPSSVTTTESSEQPSRPPTGRVVKNCSMFNPRRGCGPRSIAHGKTKRTLTRLAFVRAVADGIEDAGGEGERR